MYLAYAIGALGAVIVALLGAAQFARRFSGKIKSSEAVTLWAAQEEFRKDLMSRNDQLRVRLDECEKTIKELMNRQEVLEEANAALHLENGELKAKLAEYDELISTLRADNDRKDSEIDRLRGQISGLQKRVRELEGKNV